MEGNVVKVDSNYRPQQLCLLCFKTCGCGDESVNAEQRLVVTVEKDNTLLQKHLQQIFILRKILNVPAAWCVKALKKCSSEEGQEEKECLEKWFRVCGGCTETVVKEAWELHHKIVELQGRMEQVKGRVRNNMVGEVRRRRGKRGDYEEIGRTEKEIYEALFNAEIPNQSSSSPSVLFNPIAKTEPEPTEVEDDLNVDTAWSPSPLNMAPDSDLSDASYSPFKPSPKVQRRGRGRPPKIKPNKETSDSLAPGKRRRGRPPLAKTLALKSPQKLPTLSCTLCPSKYRLPETLASHLEAHKISSEFSCPQCSYPALSSDELDQHIRLRHSQTGLPCPECSFSGSVRKLKAHLLQHHPDVASQRTLKTRFVCPICSQTCVNKSALTSHQKMKHPEQFNDSEDTVPCNLCGLLFAGHIRLRYHLKSTHLRVNNFVCDDCGKGFRWEKSLQVHSLVHQKNARDHVCDICGLDFKYEASLNDHIQKYHPNGPEDKLKSSEEHHCKYCEVKSPFKVVITRHIKTVHIKEMGHECDLCGNCYSSEAGLKRHLKINHPADESERVKCANCLKEFVHLEYLKMHQAKYCALRLKPQVSEASTS